LPEGRVACGTPSGGWTVENAGHALRPPSSATTVGGVTEFAVANTPGACAQAPVTAKLVVTGVWPVFDAGSFTLALDEGRLEARGRGLRGVLVTWPVSGGGRSADACGDPKTAAGTESCAWGVPKTLSADPTASALRWLPAGAQATTDAVLFDADGRPAPPATFAIVPSRVEIEDILPADPSIDVSAGVGAVPVSHPEAVTGVDCGAVRCTVENGNLVVQAPPASATSVDVKFRLATHVIDTRKSPPDPQPVFRVPILRCPMSVVSGPILRATDSARTIVRLEGACVRDVNALHFVVLARLADVVRIEPMKGAAFAVLSVGSIDASNVTITALRGEGEGAAVAVTRTETAAAPIVRTVLEIPNFPPVNFIPNNRHAIVHFPHVEGAELVLLPIQDVYEATNDPAGSTVQGDVNAAGLVTLQFGYRIPKLPTPLDKVDVAVLSDVLQRPVKEANLPAPFAESAMTAAPLVELDCADVGDAARRIQPGSVVHLPFELRDGCRVVFHRERLSSEYGTQKVSLEVEVDKLDGASRGESHVTQTLVLRAGPEARTAWIKGVVAPYDRVNVRLSYVADESHYLGALEIPGGTPAVQWSVVFGTGRVRLYATTAIPTGLYRFGASGATSGVLSLSLGILSRFTWLDSEGHEGLLGLEAGLMVFGLTGDQSTAGQSLTQVGAVVGVGLSIPIAAAGAPTQASINLHAWGEQRITGSGPEAASPRAIIFGPSISLGNIGTTF
jgi:hypothetical protein